MKENYTDTVICKTTLYFKVNGSKICCRLLPSTDKFCNYDNYTIEFKKYEYERSVNDLTFITVIRSSTWDKIEFI